MAYRFSELPSVAKSPSPGHKPSAGVNNPKDKLENQLNAAVCAGKMTLEAAQNAIAGD